MWALFSDWEYFLLCLCLYAYADRALLNVAIVKAAAVLLGAVEESDCAGAMEHAVRVAVDFVVRKRLIAGY